MKKNLLYLFTVLCTLSFFTACSDDDDPKDPNVLDVNTAYSGDKLDLKYSDSQLLGKQIAFDTKDGKTATITMKGNSSLGDLLGQLVKSTEVMAMAPGVIPGEITTTISNVPLTLSGEKYTFEGEYTGVAGVKATYSGEVQKDKLTMSVKATMPANDLTGTWALAPLAVPTSMPIVINWQSSAMVKVDGTLLGMPPGEVEVPVNTFLQGVNVALISPKLAGVLQSITYKEDGNIVASYKKAGASDWTTSPLNLAQYYIKDNKLYVQLNIDQIMATVQANKNKSKADMDIAAIIALIQPFMSYLSEGVPLSYTVANGTAQVTLGYDVLGKILPLLADESIGGMIAGLLPAEYLPILSQLPAILEKTENVSATLVLTKK